MVPDLLSFEKVWIKPKGFSISNLIEEEESKEYGAYSFKMDNQQILFRSAKITPTKIGQFVTLWKRIGNGPILPFDEEDPIDLFVVSVRTLDRFGAFVFPKSVLCEKGIISQDRKEGKRAMRVYPSWDVAENTQAKKTQKWQLLYFSEF